MECLPLENEASKLSQNVWLQTASDAMLHTRRMETSNALCNRIEETSSIPNTKISAI
jgi:hypothetical protein